jgi:hypothetical protein
VRARVSIEPTAYNSVHGRRLCAKASASAQVGDRQQAPWVSRGVGPHDTHGETASKATRTVSPVPLRAPHTLSVAEMRRKSLKSG